MPEELIENSLSELGLRTMHIVSTGEPVDLNNWYQKVPDGGKRYLLKDTDHEEALDVYHLWLYWNACEPVNIEKNGSKQPAVIWYLGLLDEINDTVLSALDCFKRVYGVDPEKILTKKKESIPELEFPTPEIKEAEWVPKRYLFVV